MSGTQSDPTEAGRVVLFDGTCGFCAGAVRFIARRDRTGAFRFAPSQSTQAQALLARAGLARASAKSLVLVEGGRAYLRSDAALRIARHLAFPWWLAAAFLVVPRPIRDLAYRGVAALRHRLARRPAACEWPPDVDARLL
jgi:predicted DCC family thiol-disulfide oxidoreductase YuxK